MARNFTGISILNIQLIMQISHSIPSKDPKIASANTPRVFAGLRRVSWTYSLQPVEAFVKQSHEQCVICEQFVDFANSKPFVRLIADLCETPPNWTVNNIVGPSVYGDPYNQALSYTVCPAIGTAIEKPTHLSSVRPPP